SHPDAVRRFCREMRAVSKLEHPNLVRAYDADEVGGVPYLAMEYLHGTNLAQLVKAQGPLPVAQACDFIRQAAQGMQHAFERGLIHRDLKPANLLVIGLDGPRAAADQEPANVAGPAPVVKILDLGLARPAEDGPEESTTLTKEGMVVGTPDYMSPE